MHGPNFEIYDQDGRVKDENVARDMAEVEAPYHENAFGLKPSTSEIQAGDTAATEHGKSIARKIDYEQQVARIKEFKNDFKELLGDGWMDAAQYATNKPDLSSHMFPVLKETYDVYIRYEQMSVAARNEKLKKQEIKFLPEQSRERVIALLELNTADRESIGFNDEVGISSEGAGGRGMATKIKTTYQIREMQ